MNVSASGEMPAYKLGAGDDELIRGNRRDPRPVSFGRRNRCWGNDDGLEACSRERKQVVASTGHVSVCATPGHL